MSAESVRPKLAVLAVAVAAATLAFFAVRLVLERPHSGRGADDWTPSTRPAEGARPNFDEPARRSTPSAAATEIARPRPIGKTSTGDADPVFFAFAGRVQDERGEPIADADVRLLFDSPLAAIVGGEAPVAATTKSDARGAFLFDRVDGAQRYRARASHPRFASAELKGLAAARPGTLTREITLFDGATVLGRVRAAGAAVAGARVRVLDLARPDGEGGGAVEGEAATDAEGRFRIARLSAGGKAVRVDAAGFVAAAVGPVRLVVGAPETALEISVVPGAALSGRVLRERDGDPRPVAGATVVPKPVGGAPGFAAPTGAAWPKATTASDGSFAFEALPDALYVFRVRAPGDVETIASTTPSGAAADASAEPARPGGAPVELRLPKALGGSVRGRAFDSETGAPITRFFVSTTILPDPSAPAVERRFVAAADGHFSLHGVRAGSWFVAVEPEGAPTAFVGPISVAAGEETAEVEVAVTRGVVVRGRVLDDRGRPLAGATIVPMPKYADGDPLAARQAPPKPPRAALNHAAFSRAQTAEDGTFELRVARGTWRFGVAHPGAVGILTEPYVCHADFATGDLFAKRAGALVGVVRDDEGRPDPEATVTLTSDPPDSGATMAAATDAEGRYELRGFAPGAYWARLLRKGGALTDGRPAGRPFLVSFGPGDVVERDF